MKYVNYVSMYRRLYYDSVNSFPSTDFFLINGGMFCDTKNGFPVKILSFVAVANLCSCGCAAWGRSE